MSDELADPGGYLEHDAVIAAEKRGQQAILREIAKLPSPIECDSHIGTKWTPYWYCRWCDVEWDASVDMDAKMEPHPESDCLWSRALRAARQE